MSEEFEQKVIEYLDKIYSAMINKSENRETPKDIKIEESIEQTFDKITYIRETEKAVLFQKNGYQVWVPKKAIKEGYNSDANQQDIELYDWFTPTWKEVK